MWLNENDSQIFEKSRLIFFQSFVETVFGFGGGQERIEVPHLLLGGGLGAHILVTLSGDDLLLTESIQDGIHRRHMINQERAVLVDKVLLWSWEEWMDNEFWWKGLDI